MRNKGSGRCDLVEAPRSWERMTELDGQGRLALEAWSRVFPAGADEWLEIYWP